MNKKSLIGLTLLTFLVFNVGLVSAEYKHCEGLSSSQCKAPDCGWDSYHAVCSANCADFDSGTCLEYSSECCLSTHWTTELGRTVCHNVGEPCCHEEAVEAGSSFKDQCPWRYGDDAGGDAKNCYMCEVSVVDGIKIADWVDQCAGERNTACSFLMVDEECSEYHICDEDCNCVRDWGAVPDPSITHFTITGTVKDHYTGNGIPGASISLTGIRPSYSFSTTTDAQGRFSISNVPRHNPGDAYATLSVSAENYGGTTGMPYLYFGSDPLPYDYTFDLYPYTPPPGYEGCSCWVNGVKALPLVSGDEITQVNSGNTVVDITMSGCPGAGSWYKWTWAMYGPETFTGYFTYDPVSQTGGVSVDLAPYGGGSGWQLLCMYRYDSISLPAGAFSITVPVTEVCTPSWTCTAWSTCVSGQRTRTCTDTNNCGILLGKPSESKSCETQCTPSWECTDWSLCIDGQQIRTCTDTRSCGTTTGKPATTQTCTVGCTPSWTCTAWSTCVSGQQTRTCTDSNSCGTTSGKPATTQTCTEGCTPQCSGKECGSDGCGGSCGECSTGEACASTGTCYMTTGVTEIELKSGWNLIGSFSSPVNFNDVKGDCIIKGGPDILNPETKLFEFVSVLEPGRGHLVRTTNDCTLEIVS